MSTCKHLKTQSNDLFGAGTTCKTAAMMMLNLANIMLFQFEHGVCHKPLVLRNQSFNYHSLLANNHLVGNNIEGNNIERTLNIFV